MKKILIFSHGMEIGGAERALLGLLEQIDYSKFEVDLFLMHHSGELLKFVPTYVRLLPELPQYACLAVPIKTVIRKGHFAMALGRCFGKIVAKKRIKDLNIQGDNEIALEYSHKYTCPFVPKISVEQYDLAISFLTPHYFVTKKVKARYKIAWIHTDYSFVSVDRKSQVKMWACYDLIASISPEVTNSFITTFPELSNKVEYLPNILPTKYLNEMTDAFSVDQEMKNDGSIKILSIGRFSYSKNFDNIPAICMLLREKGVNVKWYIIGYGSGETIIRQKIREYHCEEYVIILGKKENPYPYIRACDIYVQPSRYEGKCVSVIEAQTLHKPVVITNYSTSNSQLVNGEDGIIVPMDNQGCADGLYNVIIDKKLQSRLIANTKQRDYSNSFMVEKLYDIMNK